ncbi:hypothetical protein ABPG74_017549 [Tetrahymena malaccensis]
MKQISKSCLISGIFLFLLIKINLCQPIIYDSNLGIYQCENKSLVINQYLCSPYNNCQNSQFFSKCNQGIINSDLNLYQCLDCSLVIDIRFCNLNCQNLQFYSQSSSKCMTYCGNGFIVFEYMNCNSNYNLCIDGFIFSQDDNKCIKVKSCQQQIFDKSLNLFLCPNCGLISNIGFCNNGCSAGYYSQTYGCMQYCRNGLIAKDQFSCQTSNTCIDGFQWSQQDGICKKCNYSLIDKDFNLYQCPNCIIISNIKQCSYFCGKFQYQSKQNQCLLYCGNGELSNVADKCLSNIKFCVDGFFKSNLDNKCKRCGDQSTFDTYFNLYTCLNCSFVSNIQDCNNPCKQSEYFSQSFGCRYYCGNGLVTYGGQENCNSANNSCIDGFYFNNQNRNCQKSCVQNIFDSRLNIYQCSNCSLVTDIQCKNCILVTNLDFCQKSCINSQYYSSQYGCMVYCGKGLLAQSQDICQNTNICIDGFQFNQLEQKCLKCKQTDFVDNIKMNQCENCSLVTDIQFCQNSCSANQFYSQQKKICMYYCGNGVVANDLSQCFSLSSCVDEFFWNPYTNQCEKYCSHNQYYSQQEKQCMYYCGSGLIAYDLFCSFPKQCIDGFEYKGFYKCENIQQTVCPNTTLPDSFVKICSNCSLVSDENLCNFCERIVESNLKLYQCPNCSLVTNTQFCKNSCAVSQVYSYANCMVHCGNGLIAKDQMSCQSSNLCIEGFIFTSQGICNPKNSKINQEMDQNFMLINILIPLFLVFFIVIFLCWVVKKLKLVLQIQAKNQELQKQQYEEAQIKILNHQQEIDHLKQKENIKLQNELNQNQIILNINNENDIEEQSLSKQTVNMIENFNPYQQNIDSQEQYQQLPILENQESG